ncbi:MAG: hypothetical protein KDD42_07750, partial [Bdellovibrionales bacterium]|nr:hypothetical protein [Bdellovibrionales bacterium]
MEVSEHLIRVERTARYFVLGDIQRASQIWIACHGYGQSARYLCKQLKSALELGHAVIAPEGLSRFYLSGFNGKVGPSWMTKEARLQEISDYISYLNALVEELGPSKHIHVLGFSQGAATVSRWIAAGSVNLKSITLCCGLLPPDLDLRLLKGVLKDLKILMLHGDQDPFISKEKVEEQLRAFNNLEIAYQVLWHSGAHE